MTARPRALVVGATSEIGRGLAVLGHDLVLWGRRAAELEAAAAAVRHAGADVRTEVVDVTDDAAVRLAVARLTEQPLRVAVWTPGLFEWGRADRADPEA